LNFSFETCILSFHKGGSFMAHIEYSENGNSPLQRLLGHNQEVLKKWDLLLDTFYQFSSFDPQLQEEVRRAIAYQIGCAQCMSFGCPSQIIQDPKTKVAVDFARKMTQTALPISTEDIEKLKKYFSDKEIAELCAFIAFGTGYARFGAVLSVDVKT
jgi:alkylhydroperoxidase family enzyme